jgi:urease accessory protein
LTSLSLLLLADGRLPAGGHAHSGGVEAAIADGRVHDIESLGDFVVGRVAMTGLVEAAFAAATVVQAADMPTLDIELDARITPLPAREASRRLGRSLARVASRCWPDPVWLDLPDGAHQPIALGVACIAAGASARDAATVAVHHAISTPALAGVRLMGLDPLEVAALTASIAGGASAVIDDAIAAAHGLPADLPALAGPLLDVAAMEHSARELRMFAT